MTAALGSPFDVSGAAHLPAAALRGDDPGFAALGPTGEAVTLLRLEGIVASAAHRAAALGKQMAPFGTAQIIEDAASAVIWNAVRDVVPFAASGVLGDMAGVADRLPGRLRAARSGNNSRAITGGQVIYDWGGGLIWAALPERPDAQAALVRQRADAVGGHAMLLRASDEVRRNADVFHPQPAGVASLSERGPPELRSQEHPQSRPG